MMVWQLKVTKNDGSAHAYRISAPHIVAFEREFGMGLARAFKDDQKLEHILWLAWYADKRQTGSKTTFDEYVDTVDSVGIDENTNPSDGTP